MARSASSQARPVALVTGASSGIGRAFAWRLAEGGFDLVLVARRQSRLDALAKEIRNEGVSCEKVVADLTDPQELREVAQLLARERRLEFLVNNAGFGTGAPFVDIDAERLEAEIRLNVLALIHLTRAALPGMLARRSGAIINVSSATAFQPNPFFANYGATKAYVNSVTQALADEYRGTGVRFQALCPGPVNTEFAEVAQIDIGRFPAFTVATAEEVVEASLRQLGRRGDVCMPGSMASAATRVTRLLPRRASRRLYRKFGDYFYRR